MKTMRNGTLCEMPDDGVHPEQTKTFDDIPKYSLIKLRGYIAYVLDKGEHIGQRDGKFMLVSYESENAPRTETQIHERVVNKYLHEQKNLFVDFTGDMVANHSVVTENVQAVPEDE